MKLRTCLILLWSLLAGCAATTSDTTTSDIGSGTPENMAVQMLLQQSQTQMQSGHTRTADGLIERALRIDPQDPNVWHALALTRVAQDPQQALDLARKSNALTGPHDVALQASNWALIAEAWSALGHARRAEAAKARAAALTGP